MDNQTLDPDVEDLLENYSWMMRPCALYKEEYNDCTAIRSRFHQRFVTGEFSDCSQWKHDYDNCMKWRNEKNPKAMKDLIDSEKERRTQRLNAHNANDVWQRRSAPPSDWNAPLPAWMEEKLKNSYLYTKAQEQKEGKLSADPSCVIS